MEYDELKERCKEQQNKIYELQGKLQTKEYNLRDLNESKNFWKAFFFILLFTQVFYFFAPKDHSMQEIECDPTAYYPC